MSLDENRQRAALISRIWEVLARPSAPDAIVRPPRDVLVNELLVDLIADGDLDDGALEDSAQGSIVLIVAGFFFGNRVGDGLHVCAAYDLGDDYYYVTVTLDEDGLAIRSAIPKSVATEGLVEEERAVAWECFANSSCPTSIRARSLQEPWFGHLMVDAVSNWSAVQEDTLQELNDHIRRYMENVDDSDDGGAVIEFWNTMVNNPSESRIRVPPGLLERTPFSDSFDAWILKQNLEWSDDQQPISLESARILRLICRYLACNDQG